MLRILLISAVIIATVYSQATSPLFPSSACFEDDSIGFRVDYVADESNSCV